MPGCGFAHRLRTPVLAALMQHPRVLKIMTAGALLQVGLTTAGVDGWQCPIHSTFGIPCPGCGLSTAMALFVQGKWREAFYSHAFAPVFLAVTGLLTAVALMPEHLARRVVRRLAVLEKRTGIVAITALAMLIYWVLRLSGGLAFGAPV